MFNSIFQSVLDSSSETLDVSGFIICIGVSILIGIFLAFMYAFRTKYTKSFVITLAMLPAVVCTVIMMVNGNIGAGVAVAGHRVRGEAFAVGFQVGIDLFRAL